MKSIRLALISVLANLFQHVVVEDLTHQPGFVARIEDDVLDLLVDVSLFIGQEKVDVAIAADQRFLFEPLQAGFDLLPERQAVAVDPVDAERDEIIDAPLDFLDVADQEEDLEQADVEGLQARVRSLPGRSSF